MSASPSLSPASGREGIEIDPSARLRAGAHFLARDAAPSLEADEGVMTSVAYSPSLRTWIDPTSATTFAIGATPEETTANLSRTLQSALTSAANTELSASSTARAALNFFEGSPAAGLSPRRVAADGNGYAEAASAKTLAKVSAEVPAA